MRYKLFGSCNDVGGSPTSFEAESIEDVIVFLKNTTDDVSWFELEENGKVVPFPSL